MRALKLARDVFEELELICRPLPEVSLKMLFPEFNAKTFAIFTWVMDIRKNRSKKVDFFTLTAYLPLV